MLKKPNDDHDTLKTLIKKQKTEYEDTRIRQNKAMQYW